MYPNEWIVFDIPFSRIGRTIGSSLWEKFYLSPLMRPNSMRGSYALELKGGKRKTIWSCILLIDQRYFFPSTSRIRATPEEAVEYCFRYLLDHVDCLDSERRK